MASDAQRLLERWMRGEGAPSSLHNIVTDRSDDRLYTDMMEQSTELQALKEQRAKPWDALLADVFATYWKYQPGLVLEDDVSPGARVNRKFVERMLEDPTVAQTRTVTMLDDLSSAFATLETGRTLLQEIQNRPELRQAMQAASTAETLQSSDGQPVDMPDALAALGEAMEGLEKNAQSLRRAVRIAAEAGQEKADEVQTVMGGWGSEIIEEIKQMPFEKRLEMVQRLLSSRFKKMAELIGRFRNLARQRQKQRIKHRRDEIHSITIGRDIAHVLPSEIAAMKHPVRRLDFFRRYAEGKVLQYELDSQKRPERGPMIVLVDTSGSMHGYPIEWAVATAMALLDTATRQKRWTKIVFFDVAVHHEYTFAPGDRDIEKFVQIASQGVGGGTEYWPAFEVAMKTIEERVFKTADVVMVTDGVCKLSKEPAEEHVRLLTLLQAKRQHDFRIWSVLIGHDPYGTLKTFSDQVWAVQALDEEVAGEVFTVVA